jgi:hypothetical protein
MYPFDHLDEFANRAQRTLKRSPDMSDGIDQLGGGTYLRWKNVAKSRILGILSR